MKPSQRLYVQAELTAEGEIALDAGQTHYLAHVLRLGVGAEILLFNGRDGEWQARLTQIGKKTAIAQCDRLLRPQPAMVKLELWFAPIKGDRTDMIVEKATELGVARICPVVSDRTIVRKLNLERLRARAAEAAEQCGTLNVPEILEPISLFDRLDRLAAGQVVLFADEAGEAVPVAQALTDRPSGLALLTGPEGGFTPSERTRLRAHPRVRAVHLGPRILRADTATFAGLALIQSLWGDWS